MVPRLTPVAFQDAPPARVEHALEFLSHGREVAAAHAHHEGRPDRSEGGHGGADLGRFRVRVRVRVRARVSVRVRVRVRVRVGVRDRARVGVRARARARARARVGVRVRVRVTLVRETSLYNLVSS